MGLLDLPAPLLRLVDGTLAALLPPAARLILWGILAGWLTMLLYRRLSNQEKIGTLKERQKQLQREINAFDGEFEHLLPMIREALATGMRQLGLALGPALLATVPILFLVFWLAGEYGYDTPAPGAAVTVTADPADAGLQWQPPSAVSRSGDQLLVTWPAAGEAVTLRTSDGDLVRFPLDENIPIIHPRKWWNLLVANPLGYLPENSGIRSLSFDLPEQEVLPVGPGWIRGWMFSFFSAFLVASIAFKILLRID